MKGVFSMKRFSRFCLGVGVALCLGGLAVGTVDAAREGLINQFYYRNSANLKYVYVETLPGTGFFRYDNSRFYMSAWVPADFYLAYGPMNGDGAIFEDGLGGQVSITGIHNALNATVESEYSRDKTQHNLAYSASGDNWYVVSYKEKGIIYYKKEFVGSKYINTMIFSYPAKRAGHYNPLVSKVEETFKTSL